MNAGGMSWVEVSPKGTTSTLSLFVPKEEFLGKQGYEDAKSRIGKDTWVWVNTNSIEETVKDLRSK